MSNYNEPYMTPDQVLDLIYIAAIAIALIGIMLNASHIVGLGWAWLMGAPAAGITAYIWKHSRFDARDEG